MRKLFFCPHGDVRCASPLPAADDGHPGLGQGRHARPAAQRCPESAGEFVFSDPAVWKFAKDEDGKGFLALDYDRKNVQEHVHPEAPLAGPHRALKQYPLTDFVMDVELQSTTEPYGHQSLCLFFGFESPEKFYYVHLAKAADMNAHNVFIVNDAAARTSPRRRRRASTGRRTRGTRSGSCDRRGRARSRSTSTT